MGNKDARSYFVIVERELELGGSLIAFTVEFVCT